MHHTNTSEGRFMNTPKVTRCYQNHHLDSTRWDIYQPRMNDVIITTAYKSGTTWTQDIFYQLIYGSMASPPDFGTVSPWPDAYFMPLDKEQLGRWMESLTKQRFIKSHLPLDGLPYHDEVKYVVVCRDPRDVFMSFFNHYSRYTEAFYAQLNDPEKLKGKPLPKCPKDPRALWPDWISRGWFEWESEGYPFWSNLHHTQTYWDYRHLPNILFIHYNDMLEDLSSAVKTLADFADIEVSDTELARVVEATTFANVKKKITESDEPDPMTSTFAGGQDGFIFKGTNGRWRDLLTPADLALYNSSTERLLDTDCAAFLEQGRVALKD